MSTSEASSSISYDGKLLLVIARVYRKPSLTPEQFYTHWHEVHGPLATPLLKRYGVVSYRQVNLNPYISKLADFFRYLF